MNSRIFDRLGSPLVLAVVGFLLIGSPMPSVALAPASQTDSRILPGDPLPIDDPSGGGDIVPPAVTLTTPNLTQVWAMGTVKRIRWNASDNYQVTSVDLEYSIDGGSTWSAIVTGIPNSGAHDWKVPNQFTLQALVRVIARDAKGNAGSDVSNQTFEIRDRLAPTAAVTTPNGGQVWGTGSVHKVTWKATDNVAVVRVDLSYSPDSGATWSTVGAGLANTGSYQWTVPKHLVSTRALFKVAVKDSAGSAASDVSNAPFEIRDASPPTVTVTTPNGGQIWAGGSIHKVTWQALDNIAVREVDLAHSIDGGATWVAVASGMPNAGSYFWTLPNTPTSNARFRVTARDSMLNSGTDVSDSAFAIVDVVAPTVQVVAPNGGDTWEAGTVHTLSWTASDDIAVARVDLDASYDGGTTWASLTQVLAPATSFDWTVPAIATDSLRIRATARDAAGNTASDVSNGLTVIDIPVVEPPPPTVTKIVSLRADSATGSAPPVVPGRGTPWVDLAGPHDAMLHGFVGNLSSGWAGGGAPGNPYRLEFAGQEPGINSHVSIPGGSIPELQSIGGLSAAVWFRTSHDAAASRYDYILEWVQPPTPDLDPEYEGRGMSIIVQNGKLQVYANPWIDVAPVTPNTWYHVVVVKDTNDMRIYVNGERLHTGIKSHRGIQLSDVVLGASTFRVFEGWSPGTSDWFTGAIGSMELWQGTLDDAAVLASFRADSALYLPGLSPVDSAVVRLAADRADGTSPYASPGATSPWVDLAGERDDAVLSGFDGTASSGWTGDGSAASPHALVFDGVDDAVAIPAGLVQELSHAGAITAEVRFKTGSDVASEDFRYLLEWLQGFGTSNGMSLAVSDGKLQAYLGEPYWAELADVAADTWYRATVVKEPGAIRVYLDGVEVFTAGTPNFGSATSEITLGASTWRGAGSLGEFWNGSIASLELWARGLDASEISGVAARQQPQIEASRGGPGPARLALAGFHANPARGPLTAKFSLPSAAPARLDLVDVSGRVARTLEVGALGAGTHAVSLGDARELPAGVYWLSLTQSGRRFTTKATVMR